MTSMGVKIGPSGASVPSMRRFGVTVGVAVIAVVALVACDPFAEEDEPFGPTGPSVSCNIQTVWTGVPGDFAQTACIQACELRNRGANDQADLSCAHVEASTIRAGLRARDLCRAACPLSSYL